MSSDPTLLTNGTPDHFVNQQNDIQGKPSELAQVLKYQKVLAKVVNKIRASLPIESMLLSGAENS